MPLAKDAHAFEVNNSVCQQGFGGQTRSRPAFKDLALAEGFLKIGIQGVVLSAAEGMEGQFRHGLLKGRQLIYQRRVARVFASKDENPLNFSRSDAPERLFKNKTGFSEPGRGLEQDGLSRIKGGEKRIASLQLSLPPLFEGRRYRHLAQPRKVAAAFLQYGGHRFEVFVKGHEIVVPEGNRLREASGNLQKDQLRLGELVLPSHEKSVQHGLMEVLWISFAQVILRGWQLPGNRLDLAENRIRSLLQLVNPAFKREVPALLLQGAGNTPFKAPTGPFGLCALAKDAVPVSAQFRAPGAPSFLAPREEGKPGELTDRKAERAVVPIPLHTRPTIVFAIAPTSEMRHLPFMDGKLRSCLAALILMMLPVWVHALQQGQTPEDVLQELGPPNGKRSLSTGELWVYSGDITLEFVDGELVRSKGLDLMPASVEAVPPAPMPVPAPVPSPAPTTETDTVPAQEPTPAPETAAGQEEAGEVDSDEELLEVAKNLSNPEKAMEEMGWEEPSQSSGTLESILGWTIPLLFQWIFLLIAFKWVGAEAMKVTLLVIAVVDRLVILGVRWVFIDLLEFPTTFMADTLLSFIVMLGMITTLTHAKQLPTAIKVVVASKVAALVAAYAFVLLVLHNL